MLVVCSMATSVVVCICRWCSCTNDFSAVCLLCWMICRAGRQAGREGAGEGEGEGEGGRVRALRVEMGDHSRHCPTGAHWHWRGLLPHPAPHLRLLLWVLLVPREDWGGHIGVLVREDRKKCWDVGGRGLPPLLKGGVQASRLPDWVRCQGVCKHTVLLHRGRCGIQGGVAGPGDIHWKAPLFMLACPQPKDSRWTVERHNPVGCLQ